MGGPSNSNRIPVTVIGGYLGTGKTTLVNHLLRHAQGVRLAVLVNEFGSLPIDADLIEARNETVISIAGGCVCCSYGDDLLAALVDIARMVPRPDHVLLEASGVALPGSIAGSVALLQDFMLDGVVVLTCCETVRERACDRYLGDTITRQISDADIILLNKCDLVDEAMRCATADWLKAKNPAVRVVPAAQAAIPIEVLANVRPAAAPRMAVQRDHRPGQFRSGSFPVIEAVDAERLARALASPELGLLRAKGFAMSTTGGCYAIQVVGARWAVTPAVTRSEHSLVCIGLADRFDANAIARSIESAVVRRPDVTSVPENRPLDPNAA